MVYDEAAVVVRRERMGRPIGESEREPCQWLRASTDPTVESDASHVERVHRRQLSGPVQGEDAELRVCIGQDTRSCLTTGEVERRELKPGRMILRKALKELVECRDFLPLSRHDRPGAKVREHEGDVVHVDLLRRVLRLLTEPENERRTQVDRRVGPERVPRLRVMVQHEGDRTRILLSERIVLF